MRITTLGIAILLLVGPPLISAADTTHVPGVPPAGQAGIGDARTRDIPDEIFLTCDPDSFDYIYANWWVNHYISCTVSYQENTWPDCRMRIRGDSSRCYPKKSLKVKTDGDLFWTGRDVLNINADYKDETYLHTVISSRLFKEIGAQCFDASHVRLFLNGGFLGLYVSVENMDEDFLIARGLDPNGNLYKATNDGACLSIYEDIHELWEKKTNESAPWDDLQQLIVDINGVPIADYQSWTQGAFDYEEMISTLALNTLISNGSTYYHNYYMYHDINGDGRWHWFPWDIDKTIGFYSWIPYYYSSPEYRHDNPYLERALISDEVHADYWARVLSLADTHYNLPYIDPMIDSLKVVLESSVAADTTDQIDDLADWYSRIAFERIEGIQDRIADVSYMHLHQPQSFAVDPLPSCFQDSVRLSWRATEILDGLPTYYKVRYSTDQYWPEEETWEYTGITDTTFTLPLLLPEGNYYFCVKAYGANNWVEGFRSLIPATVDYGSVLPPVITGVVNLTQADSPYLLEGEVLVEAGAVLNAAPGVEIRMGEGASLRVEGELHFNGIDALPILLIPDPGATSWECISFDTCTGSSGLRYVLIQGGSSGGEVWQKAAISALDTELVLDHILFEDNAICVYTEGSEISIFDSEFDASNSGEKVNLRYGNALVERCVFRDVSDGGDAIDYDGTPEGIIRDCEFYGGTDDAIDLGEWSTAVVEGNIVVGFNDKGVSVGEGSTATIDRNIIAGCAIGVAVKDWSFAYLNHNTFYADSVAVSCYEKNQGSGGGNAEITNSILAASIVASVEVDELSTLDITWSISDTDVLAGVGNLLADPELFSPGEQDFRLLRSSPCIDAGDPASPPDPDGTRADMGAIPYNLGPEHVVINEINYHSAPDFDTEDWIEFHNRSALAVDLSGTRFKDGEDAHVFLFDGVGIEAHGYLVLCRDLFAFQAHFPGVYNVIGGMGFGFDGGGEMLRYYDEYDGLLDHVIYDDDPPWPPEPDGYGPTLELINPLLDNGLPASWAASIAAHGTPGAVNSVSDPSAAGDGESPVVTALGSNFPNPFNPQTTIPFSLAAGGHLAIRVHDASGRLVRTLLDTELAAGRHVLHWDGLDQRGNAASSGLYFISMKTPGYTASRKLVLLR